MRKTKLFLSSFLLISLILMPLIFKSNNSTETSFFANETKSTDKNKFTDKYTHFDPKDYLNMVDEQKRLHPVNINNASPWIQFGPWGIRINNNPNNTYTGKINDIDISQSILGANILIGTANGGIWQNLFAGFIDISGDLPELKIGAVASKPGSLDTILVGMGELRVNSGTGLYRTVNHGANWNRLLVNFGGPEPMQFSNIIYDKQRPDTIHLATNIGYFRSTDGGNSWTRFLVDGNPIRRITSLEMNTQDTRYLFCSLDDASGSNTGGIYRSFNAGASWFKCSDLPSNNYGNTAISICRDNPLKVYAYITKMDSNTAMGLYRSSNGGTNWSEIPLPFNIKQALGNQSFHAYSLTVNPFDAQDIFIGGVNLARSSNFGANWQVVNNIHNDIQNFAWGPSNILYCVNDGGINTSTNMGHNWSSSLNKFPITEFTSVSAAPFPSLSIVGGVEHNGIVHLYDENGGPDWQYRGGGDGAGTAFDPFNIDTIYAVNGVFENSMMPFRRSITTNNGHNWSDIENGINYNIACGQWYTSIKVDKVPPPFTHSLYAEVCKAVYKSTNHGQNWFNLNCPLTDLSDSARFIDEDINISSYGDVYVCTTDSTASTTKKLLVYLVGSGTWNDRTPPAGITQSRALKSVTVHPYKHYTVYAVFKGATSYTNKVLKSTNKGVNWTDITGTGLGRVPLVRVVPHPVSDDTLFLATEVSGVYLTTNGGQSWAPMNAGLPNGVIVTDMEMRDSIPELPLRQLVLATYGRGVFIHDLDLGTSSIVNLETELKYYKLSQNYPNPFNPQTNIVYFIPKESNVLLNVYDISGRLIRTLVNSRQKSGSYDIIFNSEGLASGIYFYTLSAGTFRETKKMMLLK